jgi:hypothetical protein
MKMYGTISMTLSRREIENNLAYIVRRTVRTRRANTALTRHILVEADRYAAAYPSVGLEPLIHQVCQSLSETVIARTRPTDHESKAALDTIQN